MNSCMYVCVYALVQNWKYATFGAKCRWSLCVIFKQCIVQPEGGLKVRRVATRRALYSGGSILLLSPGVLTGRCRDQIPVFPHIQ